MIHESRDESHDESHGVVLMTKGRITAADLKRFRQENRKIRENGKENVKSKGALHAPKYVYIQYSIIHPNFFMFFHISCSTYMYSGKILDREK